MKTKAVCVAVFCCSLFSNLREIVQTTKKKHFQDLGNRWTLHETALSTHRVGSEVRNSGRWGNSGFSFNITSRSSSKRQACPHPILYRSFTQELTDLPSKELNSVLAERLLDCRREREREKWVAMKKLSVAIFNHSEAGKNAKKRNLMRLTRQIIVEIATVTELHHKKDEVRILLKSEINSCTLLLLIQDRSTPKSTACLPSGELWMYANVHRYINKKTPGANIYVFQWDI